MERVKRMGLVVLIMAGGLLFSPVLQAVENDPPVADAALIELLQNEDMRNALVGVYAVTLDEGRVICSHHADITMIPASNNKVFTTAAALDILGPDYTYTTTLERVGTLENGILRGHLILVGSGDPTISGRFNGGDTTEVLRKWVDAVKAQGIIRVEGCVVGDDDLWNDDLYGSGWDWSEIGEWYSAPSSALSFNDNCVDLLWVAGEEVGRPASFTQDPDTRYLHFRNYITTRAARSGSDRYYHRGTNSREVDIRGGMDIHLGTRKDSASVDNPTLYFATVFCEMLEKAGVEVTLGAADIDQFPIKQEFKEGRTRIASHTSPPLSEIINVINRVSQNFYANQVLRTLGQQVKGVGGYREGTQVVKEFLERNQINTSGFVMVDGCGLSWENHTTPRTMVETLRFMRRHPHSAIFVDSLPSGAKSGHLSARFNENDTQKMVKPSVVAKTGLIGFTRTLSGYCTTDSGEEVVFSVMLNNYTAGRAYTWIDRIVTLIATEGKAW